MKDDASTQTRHLGAARLATAPRLAAALGASLGALLLAACSSSASPSTPSTPSSAPASTPATATATGLVITTKTGSAGSFLTDGSGRSIYLWEKDGKDSSACSGGCASAWPPVTTTGALTVSGAVNKADLSTFTRSDGSKQVAYDGHPLYYFVGDPGPGQVTGQGSDSFGAPWYLLAPAGSAITGAVTVSSGGAASPSATARSGY
jgi:predicted lipoprotein with Yx(FWY)xxD motif